MKDQDFRERSHQELARAPLLVTFFTPPIGNHNWGDGFQDSIRDGHFAARGSDIEFHNGIVSCIRMRACGIVTPKRVCDLESHQLVKEGDLVAEKLEKFM